MAKVTPGFKLYLYQLLSRELGFGKQTLLPQVEETLAADDIIPADLECETVQELVEACPDFLKLTVFKKGRAYATVLRVDEWDQMLAAPTEKEKPAGNKGAGGPKTWKKKKGGKKSFKAVKPGKQRRDREAAEAAAAAEREAAEAAAAAEREAAEAAAAAERETAEAAAAAEDAASEPQASEAQAAADELSGTIASKVVARTVAEIMAEARAMEQAALSAQIEPATSENEGIDSTPQSTEPEEQQATPEAAAVPEPAPVTDAEPDSAPEPEPAPEPTPTAPTAPEPSPISLTITYDPYEDMERELERQRQEQTPVPQRDPQPQPAPAAAPAAPSIPLQGLPQDFGSEVACKDALLRALYQLLPYDVDPMAVLDEDWRMARSTGSLSGSRVRVTFPLRYLHQDGTPITATLRKSTKNAFGKQWSLALVDGDDGTGETHLSVGIEGLPSADEGAWSDLSTSADTAASPIRALAQDVVIGTWDAFLGALSALAAPERWNYPGEGVGRQSRYGILREYIATTYLQAKRQQLVAQATDGSFATFHTGLATSLGDDIYACLTKRSDDIPWQFVGFATAGSGELGARLAGTIAQLPSPPSYLSSLDDVVVAGERMVILDTDAILGRQLGRLPRAFLAERLDGNSDACAILSKGDALAPSDLQQLARVIRADASAYRRLRRALDDTVAQAVQATRASYRLAAPVFDPTDGRTKLLVPLCLVEDGEADCALVLDLQPSGAYRAAAILPLARAYACARVISREQPDWLAARRVL